MVVQKNFTKNLEHSAPEKKSHIGEKLENLFSLSLFASLMLCFPNTVVLPSGNCTGDLLPHSTHPHAEFPKWSILIQHYFQLLQRSCWQCYLKITLTLKFCEYGVYNEFTENLQHSVALCVQRTYFLNIVFYEQKSYFR